jgi:hypothetical protein
MESYLDILNADCLSVKEGLCLFKLRLLLVLPNVPGAMSIRDSRVSSYAWSTIDAVVD